MQLVLTRTIEPKDHSLLYVVHVQLVVSDAERAEIAQYHLYPMIAFLDQIRASLHGEWSNSTSFINGTHGAFLDMRDAERFAVRTLAGP